jgi:hypothetical protein
MSHFCLDRTKNCFVSLELLLPLDEEPLLEDELLLVPLE